MYSPILFRQQMVCHKLYQICKFTHIVSALHHLHQAKWVHRDFAPGNVIVVGTTARISDFEFATQRAVDKLEELTRPNGASLSIMRDIRVVGSSFASLTNQTDLDQGTLPFVASEVEEGQYAFFPNHQSVHSGSRKDDQRVKLFKDGEAMNKPVAPTKRIFLHNPLHDYESIWWIAIWFIFSCEPEGVPKHVMERARNQVYRNRFTTLQGNAIFHACELLPTALQPLGNVLVEIKNTLAEAYRSFEDSFDGSEMLLVFEELRGHLLALEERAKGLAAKPPTQSQTLNVEGMEQFDAVVLEEELGWQMAEHEGGAMGQSIVTDNPPVSVQHEDAVLGKRTRVDPPSKVDRALRPRTSQQ